MYYVAYTPTYLIIDSGLTDLHPDFKFVNFQDPAALTALDNGTMLRCLAALAFETEGQLPAEPATIIFDLVTQAELPVSLGERTEPTPEPALAPAQGAGQYYILHSLDKLTIGQSDDDVILPDTDTALVWVATSEDLDSMPSDLMLRVLLALGYDKGTLPPEASEYTFKLLQRSTLPVTVDGVQEPPPPKQKEKKIKKSRTKGLPSVPDTSTSSTTEGDAPPVEQQEQTMDNAEKKLADKQKADAAKLKAKEKAAADKAKAAAVAAKEQEKLKAAKTKEKEAAAKQKAKEDAEKAKAKAAAKDAKAKEKAKAAADKQKVREAKAAERAAAGDKPSGPPREGTTNAKLIAMCQRDGGATMPEMLKMTGWKSCRGTLGTLAARMGLTVTMHKDPEGKKATRWTVG